MAQVMINLRLNLDENAGRYDSAIQRLDGPNVGILYVNDSLVGANLKLFTALFINVRTA